MGHLQLEADLTKCLVYTFCFSSSVEILQNYRHHMGIMHRDITDIHKLIKKTFY